MRDANAGSKRDREAARRMPAPREPQARQGIGGAGAYAQLTAAHCSWGARAAAPVR